MARWRIPIYCELARQLVERWTPEWRARDHLRRVFCPQVNLAAGTGNTLYRLVFRGDRFKQRTMMLGDGCEYMF